VSTLVQEVGEERVATWCDVAESFELPIPGPPFSGFSDHKHFDIANVRDRRPVPVV
jgi:hypothetical protein